MYKPILLRHRKNIIRCLWLQIKELHTRMDPTDLSRTVHRCEFLKLQCPQQIIMHSRHLKNCKICEKNTVVLPSPNFQKKMNYIRINLGKILWMRKCQHHSHSNRNQSIQFNDRAIIKWVTQARQHKTFLVKLNLSLEETMVLSLVSMTSIFQYWPNKKCSNWRVVSS